MLFSFMQEALGDLPMNILVGVADEVLVTLKNDKMSSKEKKKQNSLGREPACAHRHSSGWSSGRPTSFKRLPCSSRRASW